MQVTVVEYINEFFTQYSRRAYGKTVGGNASKGAEVFMGGYSHPPIGLTQPVPPPSNAPSALHNQSETLALLQSDSSSTAARFPLFLPRRICCFTRAGMLKLVLSRGGRDELRIALHCFKDQLTAAINRSAASSSHHPSHSGTKQSAQNSRAASCAHRRITSCTRPLKILTPLFYRCCHCTLHTPRALRPKHILLLPAPHPCASSRWRKCLRCCPR